MATVMAFQVPLPNAHEIQQNRTTNGGEAMQSLITTKTRVFTLAWWLLL